MAIRQRIGRRGACVHAGLYNFERVGRMNRKGYRHIQWEDRLQIQGALRAHASVATIAESTGFCKKTIYNEIQRGMCVQQHDAEFVMEYCADYAEMKYQENLRAKGPDLKMGHDHAFAAFLEQKIIVEHFSPGAALHYIEDHGLKFDTTICENTLYNYIYRGDVFLALCKDHLLYKGKNHKHTGTGNKNRARQAKGETIENRPKEILERAEFGHWEMDSIMGTVGSHAALLVLTERKTRNGIVIRVPDHTAESVVRALNRLERRMGAKFRDVFRTITVDNGCEFQACDGMEKSLRARLPRTKIFYCHPYSAYERGSNENMNRIIRRFFPKGTNFDNVTAAEVAAAEEWMNNYPRKILGWRSSASLFKECIEAAA